ncbi:MAG: helix-turn-helix domain-containing protein, partial [Firmicutes bacterium]|nr:helix-turn-helix domain-containing protein [Bacillota bacterium]
VVERTLLMTEDSYLTVDSLPREVIGANDTTSRDVFAGDYRDFSALSPSLANRSTRKLKLGEHEKEKLVRTLDKHGGNISKTAAELGMSRNTVYRKMAGYDISN